MGLLGVGLIQVPAQDSQTDPFFGAPDWQSLGLILAVVGCFLLANSILFRDPRALVRAHFGKDREKLLTLREQLFQRVQLTLGFGYLLGGFALQLYGRLHPPSAGEVAFPVLWIGIVVVLTVALQSVGWWWSLHSFRRYVREHLRAHVPDFETDVRTAREVGELFGLETQADETVQSYARRLNERLRLPVPGRVLASEREAEPVYEEL